MTSPRPPQFSAQEIPALLRLWDDASPNVRQRVLARLRSWGPQLWVEMQHQGLELTPEQQQALEQALELDGDQILDESWRLLQSEPDELVYLEKALFLLAEWLMGPGAAWRGGRALDALAAEFSSQTQDGTSMELAHFLFETKGFHGAASERYYEPENSNLVFALENGSGLPITLSCLFILVGARCGLEIEGCGFPGHFLARDKTRDLLFDPYNHGRLLGATEVDALLKAAPAEMRQAPTAREIAVRVLRNLSLAFHHTGHGANAAFMLSLARVTEGRE